MTSANEEPPQPEDDNSVVVFHLQRYLLSLIGLLTTLGLVGIPWSYPRSDSRFGTVEAYIAPVAAGQSGAGWERVRLNWADLQPDGPGQQWRFQEWTVAQLDRERAEGREIVGLLIGVPAWARDVSGLPKGLPLAHDDPENLWAGFVRQAVARFRGQITHWIMWNEPDVWQADHPAFSWPGSVRDFVQLMKVSYLAAHRANPDAVIHLAGLSQYWDANFGRDLYFRRFLDEVTRAEWGGGDHGYYFDAATLHLYFNPLTNYDLLIQYQAIMRAYGLEKPIWLIETNAPPTDDPAWVVADPLISVSQEEQAAYIPQMLALALAAGAERVGVYKMRDAPREQTADPEPFGLLRLDGTSRPGYLTYRAAVRMLAGMGNPQLMERESWVRVRLEGKGRVLHVLWARFPGGSLAVFPAEGEQAEVFDQWGREVTVLAPMSGRYEVGLQPAMCSQNPCTIGGPVLYVVEESR